MVLTVTRSVFGRFPRSTAARLTALLSALAIAVVWLPAGTAFAAAGVASFQQCANGKPGASNDPTTCNQGWINGNLNAQKSQYHEDQVVPQRVVVTGLSAGSHTFVLDYQALVGGVHAWDSLATWNYTVTNADRCAGLSPTSLCVPGTASTFLIPDDPTAVNPVGPSISPVTSAHQLPNQVMTMYGGTLTGISTPVHSGGTNDDATVTVSFSTTGSNQTVNLLFGGHVASSTGPRGWGGGLGAFYISGAPFHIGLDSLDSASTGSMDNQLMPGAILPALGTTIVTTATPTAQVGSPISDTATITPSNAAGSVVFNLYADSQCATTPVYTSPVVPVTSGSAGSGSFTPAAAGTYYWQATFTPTDGSAFNAAVGACGDTTNGNSEVTTVTKIPTTIVTTATNATVGATVSDTATVTPSTAAGSVTFSVYSDSTCKTTALATSTKPVTSGSATSNSYTTTAAGPLYWQATFNPTDTAKYTQAVGTCGDQSGGNNEISNVLKASPTITTLASNADLPNGVISDTASLSGGYNPTGTITFTIYDSLTDQGQCAGVVDTITVNVSGNGQYTATESNVFPAGSYYWLASYNGDANNNKATHGCPLGTETSTVNRATPALQTNATDATMPAAGGITDSAILSGGYSPTETLTFSAYLGDNTCTSSPAYSVDVPVNGNGTYTASFVPQTAGTYYWLVKYSGDANNNPASEPCGDLTAPNHEQSVVSPATPALKTVATDTTLPATSVSDTATLGGGDHPTGTMTFSVYTDAACHTTALFSTTVNVNGAGDYTATWSDAANVGTYYWLVSYSGDTNNSGVTEPCGSTTGGSSEVSVVHPASPTIVTTATDGALTTTTTSVSDSATLAGLSANAGGTLNFAAYTSPACTGTAAFNASIAVTGNDTYTANWPGVATAGTYYWLVSYTGDGNNNGVTEPCGSTSNGSHEISVVSPAAPSITTQATNGSLPAGTISDTATLSGGFNPQGTITFTLRAGACDGNVVYVKSVNVDGNGQYGSGTATVGDAGDYYWVAAYSGDGNNAAASHDCGILNETSNVAPAQPAISTNATADSALPGGSVSDTATLSGATDNAGGTVHFVLYSDNECSGVVWTSGDFAVQGDGDYGPATHVVTSAGTYYWRAFYSGDANNQAASDVCGADNETTTVAKASPTIATEASSTTSTTGSISDTASLTGATSDAGGTVTFRAYDNSQCTGDAVFTSTVNLVGGHATSSDFTPTGTAPAYYWIASYGGDSNNNPVAGTCGDDGETSHVPVLSAAKSSNPGSGSNVLPGEQITYSIAVTNSGTADGATTVTDDIPSGTTYVADSAACPQGVSCSVAPSSTGGAVTSLTWTLTTAADSNATVTFAVTVDADASSCAQVVNQGVVNGTPTNTVSQTVVYPSLTAVLDADPTPMAPDNTGGVVLHGQTITYTVTFGNVGTADASPATLTAPIPEGTTYVADSASDGGSLVSGLVTWALDSIPAGTTGTRTYQVTVNNDDPNGFIIHDQAHLVTVPGPSPIVTTEQCTSAAPETRVMNGLRAMNLVPAALLLGPDQTVAVTPVYALDTNIVRHIVFVPSTALAVTKGVDKTAAAPGDTLTYTLTVIASGNENQTNVVVSDILPGYNSAETSGTTTYVADSAKCSVTCTSAYDGNTHTVTWTVATMTPDETATFSYQVTIDKPTPAADGSVPVITIRNVGSVLSTQTPKTPSNVVTTTTAAVLGLKITKPAAVLPFTGSGLPLGPASIVAVMLIGLGLAMSATRRKPSVRGRHLRLG